MADFNEQSRKDAGSSDRRRPGASRAQLRQQKEQPQAPLPAFQNHDADDDYYAASLYASSRRQSSTSASQQFRPVKLHQTPPAMSDSDDDETPNVTTGEDWDLLEDDVPAPTVGSSNQLPLTHY